VINQLTKLIPLFNYSLVDDLIEVRANLSMD